MRILLLDSKQKVFKIKTEIIQATEKIAINSAIEFNGSFILNKENLKDFDDANYIGVPIEDSKDKYHIFSITSTKTNGNLLEISGIEEAYDDLSADFIEDRRLKDKTLLDNLNLIVENSRWKLGKYPNIDKSDIYYYFVSKKEALSKIVNAFGVEFQFEYEIKGNRIVNRYINCFSELGEKTTKRFVYGSSAVKVEREENRTNIYTALIGRGKGEEKFDDSGQSTGGYGRKITFKDEVWSTSKGDAVDKPSGQLWVELPEATKRFGLPNGKPKIGIVDFDEITDTQELLYKTFDQLVKISKPELQYSVDLNSVESLNLGDTVTTVRNDLGFVYQDRVQSITRDLVNSQNTKVVIGEINIKSQKERDDELQNNIDNVGSGTDDAIDDLNDSVNKKIDDTNDNIDEKIDSNNDEINKKINDIDAVTEKKLKDYDDSVTKAIADNQKRIDDTIAEAENKANNIIDNIQTTVDGTRNDLSDFMNSKGSNVIQWTPQLHNATDMRINTDSGYWLLNEHGAGFHNSSGEIMDGLSADGRIIATDISGNSLTSTTIHSGTIDAGSITGSTIDASTIRGTAISATDIDGGTISATKLTGSTISATDIDGGTITGVKIEGKSSISLDATYPTVINSSGMSTPVLTGKTIQTEGQLKLENNTVTIKEVELTGSYSSSRYFGLFVNGSMVKTWANDPISLPLIQKQNKLTKNILKSKFPEEYAIQKSIERHNLKTERKQNGR